MNVAYAYEFDADDINVRSGHPYFIREQLQKRTNLQRIFPLDRRAKYAFAPKRVLNKLQGRVYYPDREPFFLKTLAAQVERRLGKATVDSVFSPSSNLISYLEAGVPMV